MSEEKRKPVNFRVDWATHEAAKFACETWHYTGTIPVSKLVKIGAWEDDVFVGIMIFGMGASAQVHKQFNVSPFEVCDLVRVAFKDGHVTPVSRALAIALKFLKKSNPKLRVCVSFADPAQGHHGGIYQAGGWIFTGSSSPTTEYRYNGGWRHVTDVYKRLPSSVIKTLPTRKKPGKYRYVMPFDSEMRAILEERRKPYPKREAPQSAPKAKGPVAPPFHGGEGGSSPTSALQRKLKRLRREAGE